MPHGSEHNGADRRTIPEWIVGERLSQDGQRILDDWAERGRRAADADDSGSARLAAAMMALQTERPSRPLLARANARALRWVDAKLGQGRRAAVLRAVTPELPLPQRLAFAFHRIATPLAAVFVLLLCKARVLDGLESVARFGDRLARLHIDRHIGPMT